RCEWALTRASFASAFSVEGIESKSSRQSAVRSSAWLGRVRNLIHTLQKYVCVTEIREDTNSTLRGQSCRETPRADTNERKAKTATCTSTQTSIANKHRAGE